MHARPTPCPLAAFLIALAPAAAAQGSVTELARLAASDATGSDYYGTAVAVSGDTAVVGAWAHEHPGLFPAGAAYVFERNAGGACAWGEVAKLVASDASYGDWFGWSVAVSGDAIVVGAPHVGYDTGAAYVFERDQGGAGAWGEVKQLVGSGSPFYGQFGGSVAVSGDTVVVGAFDENAAYVFERDQGGPGAWGEVSRLVASGGQPSTEFGWAVAVSGDAAVVGAPAPYGGLGAAYVFERHWGGAGAWGEVKQLTGSLGPAYPEEARFGHSVAISGGTAVVGAPYDSQSYTLLHLGAAFVFERDQGGVATWGEVEKLTASDAGGDHRFGFSVALWGDTAVVGAVHADRSGVPIGDVEGLAFDPVTNTLYGADTNYDQLVTIDPLTGAGAPVGDLGFGRVEGLAFDPSSGTLYGTDLVSDQLITIDPATGAGTAVGGLGFDEVGGLAFDPVTSTLYGADVSSDQLLAIDPATGAGTVVGALGLTMVRGLAFDPVTSRLYGTRTPNKLLTIDPATGAGTVIGPLGVPVHGLAFDPGTSSLYGTDTGQLVTIDSAAGAATAVGAFSSFLHGSGAAYVFERDLAGTGTWSEVAKLHASGALVHGEFGLAVALSGGTSVVGARHDTLQEPPRRVSGLAFDPATSTLYGTDFQLDQLVTIDPLTGGATPVGALGFNKVQGLAFDPVTSTLYGADTASDQLITIDTTSGAGTAVGSFGFSSAKPDVQALAFDPGTGVLYGIRAPVGSSTTSRLFTIDTTTGVATHVGPTGFAVVQGLAFDASSGTLYGAAYDTDQLITIDTATGTGTVVGLMSLGFVKGLAGGSVASILYGADESLDELVTIDPVTGAGVAVGTFSKRSTAYVFGASFASTTYCTAGTSASGCQATLSSFGTASATAASGFDLTASTVEGAKDGMFFYGTCGRQALPWGNGTSYLCVVPPVRRSGPLTGKGTPGGCNGYFTQDLNALWCSTCPKPLHNPGPGALVQAQLWYRDPFTTVNKSTAFSDAIEFSVTP